MWEVVVWVSVLAATEAFKEPYIEYLYSRKDGQVLIEPISSAAHGSYTRNKTIYATNPDLLQNESMQYLRQLSQTREPRFLRWTSSGLEHLGPLRGQSGRQKSLHGQKKNQGQKRLQGQKKLSHSKKMKLHRIDIQIDPQIEKLKRVAKPEEVKTCTEGATMFQECNYCVCIGGQLYVCTARICEPGDMNTLIAFEKDTNCIEGEQIRSFDVCNHCYCGGGQILCTRKNCLGHGDSDRPQICTPGTNIPSPDNCNFCACNTRGFIVCTTKTCGPEISPNVKDMGCKPDTWYSMERHSRCKECYCVNGKMAFCYVNLCIANKIATLSFKSKIRPQHLGLPGALPDHCDVDDYMQDKCTKCYCTSTAVWSCKTREIGKCDPNTKQSQTTDDRDHTTTRRRKKATKRTSKTTDDPDHTKTRRRRKTTTKPSQTIDDSDHTTTRRRKKITTKPSHTTKKSKKTTITRKMETPKRNTDISMDGWMDAPIREKTVRPNEEIHTTTRLRKITTKTPSQTTDRELSHNPIIDKHIEADKDTISADKVEIADPYNSGEHTTTEKFIEYKTYETNSGDWTTMPSSWSNPEDLISDDIDDDVNKHAFTKYEPHTNNENIIDFIHIGPSTEPSSNENDKHDIPSAIEADSSFYNGSSSNIDMGPFCTKGQFFTQGSDTHCQGCFCTINNEWKCYSIKGSCRGYSEKTCNTGKLKKPSKPCSICYCGNDKKSYCATDETCSYSIKPSSCEPVFCLNHCLGEGAIFGVCHNDGCICVK